MAHRQDDEFASINRRESATVLAEYAAWLAEQPLSTRTREAYLAAVTAFVAWLDRHDAGPGDALLAPRARDLAARDYKRHMKVDRGLSPASVNQALAGMEWPLLDVVAAAHLALDGASAGRQASRPQRSRCAAGAPARSLVDDPAQLRFNAGRRGHGIAKVVLRLRTPASLAVCREHLLTARVGRRGRRVRAGPRRTRGRGRALVNSDFQ